MSMSTKLGSIYTNLDAVLDDCNASLASKGATGVSDLDSISTAIDMIKADSNTSMTTDSSLIKHYTNIPINLTYVVVSDSESQSSVVNLS